MPFPADQRALLEERLTTIGVTRRDCLKLIAAVAATGGTATLAGAAPSAPARGERLARAQVLRAGGGGYFANDPSSHDFSKDEFGGGHPALFAGLLRFDADLVARPDIAARVERSADASVWTYRLRTDARWSDGAPCTAHDFVWSWRRKLDPASGAPSVGFLYDIRNAEPFNKGQLKDPADLGLRAADDFTLVVTLEGPRSYFPILTAFPVTFPAYRPAVEKHGDKWTEAGNIVSNGPFALETWQHHQQLVLRKNPHYHDAKRVHLQQVVVPIIPLAAGFLPFENDEVDFSLVPPGDVRRALAEPKLRGQVFRYPRPQTWYLTPQVTRPPFDDPRVRRAVSHAIDRDTVAAVTQGFAIPAHTMVPPGFPGHLDDARIRAVQRFDPVAAMAALKGTPFEGGRNWPRVVLSMREQGDGAKPMAEAIQAMLAQHLHMRVDLDILEPRVFHQRLWKHEFQLVWIRWSMDYPDPHNEYFETFYGGKAAGRRQAWQNDEFDRLVMAARGEPNAARRLELYRRAEEALQADVGYVPVAWGTPYAALKPWVRGVERNRLGEIVVDSNIYNSMLTHLYIVERA